MRSAIVFGIIFLTSFTAGQDPAKESLGGPPRRLSDGTTQDSDPAACRLAGGRVIILWRAFVGLPETEGSSGAARRGSGGDRIRAVFLDAERRPGETFDVLDEPADVERIAVVPQGESGCLVVWSEQRDRNWDLFARTIRIAPNGIERGGIERLTDEPGADRSPVLAATSDGAIVLAWQGWRKKQSTIIVRTLRAGAWGDPIATSTIGNAWSPAIAASADGKVAVAWMAWNGASHEVQARILSGGRFGRVHVIGPDARRMEANPSLAYDREGLLWIAYEDGGERWGMDSHTAGLRAERNIRIAMIRGERIEDPAGNAALRLPDAFGKRSEMPHLACDGRGVRWLFFRHLTDPGVWTIHACALGDGGWSEPVALPRSAGGQDVRMATAIDAEGALLAIWTADHRMDQVGRDCHVYVEPMPFRPPRAEPIAGEAAVPRIDVEETLERPERIRAASAGREFSLLFGDLHRHTELSVCRTGADGSVEEAHRYAIDAADLDFLCVTDHVQHMKVLSDYDIWRTGKAADLNRTAGLYEPLYGYERSQRFPFGHRNIIGAARYPKRIPRTADNRPYSANQSYPGEVLTPPPVLWQRLLGLDVVTIPHTTGNPTMGTDFEYPPVGMEPVVEIYQGCRQSYEHAGAPDPRRTPKNPNFGGPTQPSGFVWNALSKGYRYGFIASSDHSATHNSYTCVWAERFEPAAILDALRARRTYAATDRIVCEMRMGGHWMGEEFEAGEVPPLEVHVAGTTEIARIDVIRDNRVVFVHVPEKQAREVTFVYRDADAGPGTHYYYARVVQKDNNMAWLSPIWVKVGQ